MDDAAVARLSLGRLDPHVMLKSRIDDEVLVVDHSGCRDLERFGHLDDEVGLGNPPAFGKRGRSRKLRPVPFGTAVVDPLGNHLLFGARHTGVIGELAILRIGVPRRHPLAVDHVPHILRPGRNLAVIGQSEGSDLARAVTLHTARLHDAGNLVRVGDVSFFRPAAHAGDAATDRLDHGGADRFTRQHVVQSIGQVVPRRGGPGIADAELVVDLPAIADRAAPVEHKHLGRARPRTCRQPDWRDPSAWET